MASLVIKEGSKSGLATELFNATLWKDELGVPADYRAYASIVLGYPMGENKPSTRKKPEIIRFLWAD